MGRKEDEERKRRCNARHCKDIGHFFVKKAVLTQNTDSNKNCYESLNIQNDVDQS